MRVSFIFLLLYTPIWAKGYSQDRNNSMGKIIYEVKDGGISYLDMWFNSSKYSFQVRQMAASPTEKNLAAKKKYESIDDSIADYNQRELILKILKENSQPVQTWFGELTSNNVIYSAFIGGKKKYCVSDTLSLINWKITDDTATVNGIFCQKGVVVTEKTKDKIVAWFAPSIPVSVAPWNMRGLPGLLIKITNETQKISMEMLELEWPARQVVSIMPPCEGATSVTRNEFNDIVNKHNSDALKLAEFYQKELEREKKGEVSEVKIKN